MGLSTSVVGVVGAQDGAEGRGDRGASLGLLASPHPADLVPLQRNYAHMHKITMHLSLTSAFCLETHRRARPLFQIPLFRRLNERVRLHRFFCLIGLRAPSRPTLFRRGCRDCFPSRSLRSFPRRGPDRRLVHRSYVLILRTRSRTKYYIIVLHTWI